MTENLKMKLKEDIMFKAFFSRNEKYLKSLIEAILGYEIKIKQIMHDVRLEQLSKEMKYGVLDLEVELIDGEIINIEMQINNNKNIEERTTFYASKKIVEQMKPTDTYKKLKKVIIIAILDYELVPELPEFVTETVRVVKKHKNYELNNLVKYYYVELEKFRKQKPNMKEKINQWLAFLDMERRDYLDMAEKENPEIKEAMQEYEELTGDEEIKRLAELRLMSKLEENSALDVAREEGAKQGKKEGIEQGIEQGESMEKNKTAKKLLTMNFTDEQIIEITGLTKEEIEKLK